MGAGRRPKWTKKVRMRGTQRQQKRTTKSWIARKTQRKRNLEKKNEQDSGANEFRSPRKGGGDQDPSLYRPRWGGGVKAPGLVRVGDTWALWVALRWIVVDPAPLGDLPCSSEAWEQAAPSANDSS